MERGDLITWEKGGGGEVSQDLLTSRDPNNVSREQSAEGWIIRRTEIKGKRPTVFLISAKPSPFLRSPIECILGVQISSSSSPLFFFPNSRFYCLNQPRDFSPGYRWSNFLGASERSSSSKLKFPASNLCHFLHVRYRVFFLWRTNRFSSWNASRLHAI